MGTEDRLNYNRDPKLPLGLDTGDQPVITNSAEGPRAALASSTYAEGPPLPSGGLAPPRRMLGRVDISDVISPNRFRRVYQSVRIRQNDVYRGPIQIVFQTHVGAMIAEELGALAPSPRPSQMPARNQTATIHQGGRITGHSGHASAPPNRSTQTLTARDLPFSYDAASRYSAWEAIGGLAGDAVDFENIEDPLNGEGTDSALERLADIVRPRSWTRHTVLQIQFRYPLMEPMLPAMSWNTDAIPFGNSVPQRERNAALQNTTTEFILMAGTTRTIEIPFPVGSTMPVHFDIINHNPLYAANVNMSAIVYVSRE